MIFIELDREAESLRPLILDVCLYNEINNINIEISKEKKFEDSIFINLNEFSNLEDVMAEFALQIKPFIKKFAKKNLPSQVWLQSKHGEETAEEIMSVLETAIEPNIIFSLERIRV